MVCDFGVMDVNVVVDEGDFGEIIVKMVILVLKFDLLVIGLVVKYGVCKYFGL